MNKRPLWIITHVVDCDGYDSYIDYIGHNLQAAWERFDFVGESLKRDYFTSQGNDDPLESWSPRSAIERKAHIEEPGHSIYHTISDDCECWISVYLTCIEAGEFAATRYANLNRQNWEYPNIAINLRANAEEEYRTTHPKSKY